MEDDLDDDTMDTPVLVAPKKGNKWLIIGALSEFIADLFKAFAKLFDTFTDESLAKFRYERNKQDFMIQAAHEIEMLTSGEHDAITTESSGSFGAGGVE